MLNKYQISVVKEEMERVDTLRFQYGNLQSKAVSTSCVVLLQYNV